MCGLFGTIRPHQYPQELRTIAAPALIDLGYLAEERGVDSAGIHDRRAARQNPQRCSIHPAHLLRTRRQGDT